MSLDGQWINELGSTMELKRSADDTLTGTYLSSNAGYDKDPEPLSGRARDGATSIYVGWTVCYHNTEKPDNDAAVCGWSGVYSASEQGEVIETTWLLTTPTDATGKWDSTLIGKNTFRRP
jgi:Avidin family